MKIIIDGKEAYLPAGSGEVYSEEETVIGMWFGKPLYRRGYYITTPNAQDGLVFTFDSSYELVKIYGAITNTNGEYRIIPHVDIIGNSTIFPYSTGNSMSIMCTSGYYNRNGILVIEYTKTTD